MSNAEMAAKGLYSVENMSGTWNSIPNMLTMRSLPNCAPYVLGTNLQR